MSDRLRRQDGTLDAAAAARRGAALVLLGCVHIVAYVWVVYVPPFLWVCSALVMTGFALTYVSLHHALVDTSLADLAIQAIEGLKNPLPGRLQVKDSWAVGAEALAIADGAAVGQKSNAPCSDAYAEGQDEGHAAPFSWFERTKLMLGLVDRARFYSLCLQAQGGEISKVRRQSTATAQGLPAAAAAVAFALLRLRGRQRAGALPLGRRRLLLRLLAAVAACCLIARLGLPPLRVCSALIARGRRFSQPELEDGGTGRDAPVRLLLRALQLAVPATTGPLLDRTVPPAC